MIPVANWYEYNIIIVQFLQCIFQKPVYLTYASVVCFLEITAVAIHMHKHTAYLLQLANIHWVMHAQDHAGS